MRERETQSLNIRFIELEDKIRFIMEHIANDPSDYCVCTRALSKLLTLLGNLVLMQ